VDTLGSSHLFTLFGLAAEERTSVISEQRGLAQPEALRFKQQEQEEQLAEVAQRATGPKLQGVESRLKAIEQERRTALQTQTQLRAQRDTLASSVQLATRYRVTTEHQQQLQAQV
jgi:hypothetical protein